jgi:hypothetical protein
MAKIEFSTIKGNESPGSVHNMTLAITMGRRGPFPNTVIEATRAADVVSAFKGYVEKVDAAGVGLCGATWHVIPGSGRKPAGLDAAMEEVARRGWARVDSKPKVAAA